MATADQGILIDPREQPLVAEAASELQEATRQRRRIDASCRGPVLMFFASSVIWLLVGTLAGLLASLKMHHPWLLADHAWLTFGRIRPLHLNLVAYGWGAMAAVGTMLWLMCRLSRTALRYPALPVLSCVVWNVGIVVGSLELLFGHSNGIEWLEFPSRAALIIFVAFGLNVVWTAITFGAREEPHVYVSQWYILGAIFWFPWLYAATNILLITGSTNLVASAGTRCHAGLDQLVVRT